jgi:hypothetical protein
MHIFFIKRKQYICLFENFPAREFTKALFLDPELGLEKSKEQTSYSALSSSMERRNEEV